MSTRESASSGQTITFTRKLDEAVRQFFTLVRSRNPMKSRDFSGFSKVLAEYSDLARRFGGFDLQDAKIFEIGCGQRPYRLCWLLAHGLTVRAVDMDKVLIKLSWRDVRQSFVSNGWERTLKTVLRYILFDRAENVKFKNQLSRIQGSEFIWPSESIVHGDASLQQNWPEEPVDFVYSEDVFEHIPRSSLVALCELMSDRLSKSGIAIVRPMVYTGIQGGHNVEYYRLDTSVKRRCPPWDHLRSNQFPSNTFLNQVTLREYRDIFSEYFEILDEQVHDPEKGRAFMTKEIRKELEDWEDEELFSNHVRFVLRKK